MHSFKQTPGKPSHSDFLKPGAAELPSPGNVDSQIEVLPDTSNQLAAHSIGSRSLTLPWSHVEWGAANYGSVRSHESDRFTPSQLQHRQLLQFIENHVKTHGESGVLYLNDLKPEAVAEVAQVVREFLKQHGLTRIEVIEYPGDYNQLPVPSSNTARVSHPESSFYRSPGLLRRLQSGSSSCLEVITHYKKELHQLMESDGLHGMSISGADSYLFPSGRAVRRRLINHRPTERWLISDKRIHLLTQQHECSLHLLPAGTNLFSWCTERRLNRLIPTALPESLSSETFDRIHPRSQALLGPGLYCSHNPYEFAGFGRTLMGIRLEGEARFLSIPRHLLRDFNLSAIKLGYSEGLNSPELVKELLGLGYHGVALTDAHSHYWKPQLVIMGPVPGAVLQRGAELLDSLDADEVIQHPLAHEYILALKRLGMTETAEAVQAEMIQCGAPPSTFRREFPARLRTVRSTIDYAGTAIFGDYWRKFSDAVALIAMKYLDAK